MPVVLLLRHGQASAGAADYDVLSDLGREQARLAGAELARRGLRDPVLVSGGMTRQRDTLTEALSRWDVDAEPRVDERLDEYDHLHVLREHGDVDAWGGDPRHLQPVIDEAVTRWAAAEEPGPLGWPAFRDRVRAAADDLLGALPSGRDAVVSTSGGVVAALVADLLRAPHALVPLNRVVVNASLTKVLVGSSGRTLVTFNDHAHLEGGDRALLTYR